jgi:hypothetical protein
MPTFTDVTDDDIRKANALGFIDRPFAPALETVLDLPIPPTVNRVRRAHGRGSKLLQTWQKQADMAVMAAGGLRKLTKMPSRYEVILTLDEGARIDLDAASKYTIDYARRLGLVQNDDKRFLRKVTIEWGAASGRCRMTLRSVL